MSGAPRIGLVLAVDLGTKRVGLALSDPSRVIASPLRTILADPASTLAERLAAVVREVEAAEVVVGLPIRMDGAEGPEARSARITAEALRKLGGIPVRLLDERLSSAAAERSLLSQGASRSRRRELSDQVAATIILQSFLEKPHARRE